MGDGIAVIGGDMGAAGVVAGASEAYLQWWQMYGAVVVDGGSRVALVCIRTRGGIVCVANSAIDVATMKIGHG